MLRSEFLDTRVGQRSLLRRRRRRRVRLVVNQHQPKGKRISIEEKVSFQKEVLGQMVKAKRRAFHSPLILEIDFYSQMDNPPAIHKLAKRYLDLLSTPIPESGINRKHLLFTDDRLIKALIVRYHLNPVLSIPKVVVKADTHRNFLADLELVWKVESDSFSDDGWNNGSWETNGFPYRLFGESESEFNEEWQKLQESIADEQGFVGQFGEKAFASMLWCQRHAAQEEYLHLMGNHAHRTTSWLLTPGNFAESMGNLREVSLSAPLTLELMHAPLRKGDSKNFTQIARKTFDEFRRQFHQLFQLSTLLNVTILFVPPERTEDKDLDNLAKLVVPFVLEILEPPANLGQAFAIKGINDPRLQAVRERVENKLPNIPRCSIPMYEVFELPRFPDDPKEGYVRLAFGPGMHSQSLWQAVDDFLSAWEQS